MPYHSRVLHCLRPARPGGRVCRARRSLVIAALLACLAPRLGAEGVSGTWMTADADRVETFIFSLTGTTFHGLVCGRCDDPSEVFRIVEGRIVDAERVTFVIEYDEGGPLFAAVGPYRASVTGTVAGNRMALLIQREGATGEPQALTLRRVVEDGVSVVERGTP